MIGEIKYTILPYGNKVIAEVSREVKGFMKIGLHDGKMDIHLTKKEFGKWYRGLRKEDFKDAKKWAEEMVQVIKDSNSSL